MNFPVTLLEAWQWVIIAGFFLGVISLIVRLVFIFANEGERVSLSPYANINELADDSRLYTISSTADYNTEIAISEFNSRVAPENIIKNNQVKPMTEIPQTRKLILGEIE